MSALEHIKNSSPAERNRAMRAAQPAGAQQPGATYAALPEHVDPVWLTDPAPTPERQFCEWLNSKRGCNVSEVFHEVMQRFASHGQAPAQAAPQEEVQEPGAGARCKIIPNCKSCQHSVGRLSCALAGKKFNGLARAPVPPEWCPLPLYTPQPSPASQGDALDAEQHEMDARHAAIYRWMLSHVADVLSIFDNWLADGEADTDELHDALAARAAQEGKSHDN